MRLGGRLSAAIDVLDDIAGRHRPVADALKDWGLSHRFAGSGDRAAIGNIVYDALRRKRSIAWTMDDDGPHALALGALLALDGRPAEALHAELATDSFAPAGIDLARLEAALAKVPAEAPAGVRADCPQWCEPLLQQTFAEDWVEEGAALAERPPLDLRVNTLKAGREKIAGALSRSQPEPTRLAPNGLRIAATRGFSRHPNVQAEPAFQKGFFEVQDEGSQIVAMLADARPGMQVLDLCAGAGGKTLALSAAMENKGQLFAHDSEKQRLAPIFERLKRAGCRNVQVAAEGDALSPLEGQMDIVLVDAPCTGSGTWRRRPDAKWRLTEKQLELRKGEQDRVLKAACAYLKPGGWLVYVTCSVFREENADRILALLATRDDLSVIDHGDLWRSRFPAAADAVHVDAAAGLSLSPARTGTDGFYLCILKKAA